MNSMQIASAHLRTSKSRLLPITAVSCGEAAGDVKLSRVDVWNSESNPKLIKCNYKHVTAATQRQRILRKTKFLVNVASESADNPEVFRPDQMEEGKSLGATLAGIYKFLKVYTQIGTAFSIISISLLAVQNLSDFTPSFFLVVLQAVVGGFFANSYVAGINQLSDIEADKINKPHLPLVSGELPVRTAILITSLYAFLGFCLGWSVQSWPLKLGLLLWYAFGTAYSVNLPLLRWKRIPAFAAICVWAVQGAIIPILFYLHAQTGIQGRILMLSKHTIFVSGFMSMSSIVAAIFKDIPDVEGDKIDGVKSFAMQFGPKKVFWTCVWLYEMAYGVAIVIGLSSARIWIRSLMVIGHGILGFILWRKANLVDLKNNEAIESFYLFFWKLYSMEYLLVPLLRF